MRENMSILNQLQLFQLNPDDALQFYRTGWEATPIFRALRTKSGMVNIYVVTAVTKFKATHQCHNLQGLLCLARGSNRFTGIWGTQE